MTGVTDFMLVPEVSGHRDADHPLALPDMRLTADEFLHWQAVMQETIPDGELAHKRAAHMLPIGGYRRGCFKPGCVACESIMLKANALLGEAERVGVAPW
jgi:hypothetical protein